MKSPREQLAEAVSVVDGLNIPLDRVKILSDALDAFASALDSLEDVSKEAEEVKTLVANMIHNCRR